MSFVAQSSCVLPASAEAAFDCLADHDSWTRWMPASFRPVGKSLGRLRPGARARVKILGSAMPVAIKLLVVDRPREITWGGGVRGIFLAEHRFLFEPKGASSVEVRSVETWSGIIASLFRRVLLPQAERVGKDQLAALAKALRDAKAVTN
jgi:hypothetical protein